MKSTNILLRRPCQAARTTFGRDFMDELLADGSILRDMDGQFQMSGKKLRTGRNTTDDVNQALVSRCRQHLSIVRESQMFDLAAGRRTKDHTENVR